MKEPSLAVDLVVRNLEFLSKIRRNFFPEKRSLDVLLHGVFDVVCEDCNGGLP